MQRPPRDTLRPLFGLRDVAFAAWQGLGLSLAIGLALAWALSGAGWHTDSAEVRSLALLTLVMGNAGLILIGSGRSWRRRQPTAWALSAAALVLLGLLMHWSLLSQALGLAPVPPAAWLVAALCSLACVSGFTLLTRQISIIRW